MYQQGYNIYKNNSVNYASKDNLLLMLVDGAVKYAKMARQAIIDKDVQKAHNSLMRTQDIFTELIVTLDTSAADWTKPLIQIYSFINEKLMEANMKKKVEIVDEILPLIEEVRDMWYEAYKKAKQNV